jgi:hypothetical protein
MKMKSILSGAAIAAVLAMTGPAWSQGSPAPAPAPAPAPHPVHHARAMHAFHHHMAHKAAMSGDTTAQANREELARIQSGAPPTPPAPMGGPPPAPMTAPSGGNSMGMPGPNTGGPGLTPYTGGAPK